MYSPLIEKHASLSTLVYFASPPYPLRGCISVILFRFASRSFCTFSLSICPSAPRVSPMSPVELSLNTVRTDSPCLQPFVSYLAGHSWMCDSFISSTRTLFSLMSRAISVFLRILWHVPDSLWLRGQSPIQIRQFSQGQAKNCHQLVFMPSGEDSCLYEPLLQLKQSQVLARAARAGRGQVTHSLFLLVHLLFLPLLCLGDWHGWLSSFESNRKAHYLYHDLILC